MPNKHDARITDLVYFLLPVETRVPLKFGSETLTHVTCLRVAVEIEGAEEWRAGGWGETPMSVQWVWPGDLPYQERYDAILEFVAIIARAFRDFDRSGHPIEISHAFQETVLHDELANFNRDRGDAHRMPWLAALVAFSAFDIALHDAYGHLHERDIYSTYNAEFMNQDLAAFLTPADDAEVSFEGLYPDHFLVADLPSTLPAWHLVGGLDLLTDEERSGDEVDDGYPVTLTEWITRDGLTCLKIKLRGNDADWDYDRLVRIGEISLEHGVKHLTTDYNCTVTDPAYVTDQLDRLKAEHPAIHDLILYVEQPFPYDLHANRIDVHSVSERQPLFLDESAHDWSLVKLGRELGWTGVALKTCKTQTGALLSACWAKAHGMSLMVQDLTNPMIAQVPHVLLAARVGTIMGVETNAMQFYPEASNPEAKVHPGLYQRRDGQLDFSTIAGFGFGYRLDEIRRELPEPVSLD